MGGTCLYRLCTCIFIIFLQVFCPSLLSGNVTSFISLPKSGALCKMLPHILRFPPTLPPPFHPSRPTRRRGGGGIYRKRAKGRGRPTRELPARGSPESRGRFRIHGMRRTRTPLTRRRRRRRFGGYSRAQRTLLVFSLDRRIGGDPPRKPTSPESPMSSSRIPGRVRKEEGQRR